MPSSMELPAPSEGASTTSFWDSLLGHLRVTQNQMSQLPVSPGASMPSPCSLPLAAQEAAHPATMTCTSLLPPHPQGTLGTGSTNQLSSSTDLLSSVAAASAPEAGGHVYRISIFRDAADMLQSLHDSTGLPWWATIPLASLTLRFALLPISMFQARVVRSNFMVYREAVQLTDKQLGLSSSSLPGAEGPGSTGSSTSEELAKLTPYERVRRGKLVLSHFGMLRSKLGAPHPIWILINPMIQVCSLHLHEGHSLAGCGGLGGKVLQHTFQISCFRLLLGGQSVRIRILVCLLAPVCGSCSFPCAAAKFSAIEIKCTASFNAFLHGCRSQCLWWRV